MNVAIVDKEIVERKYYDTKINDAYEMTVENDTSF